MKRSFFVLLSILLFTMTIYVFGENKVNLINENTEILQVADVDFIDGVLTMTNPSKAYLASLKIPGLTNNYVWSGDIKILEYGDDRKPNGVRLCVGYDADTGDFLNLIITRNIGIAAERRGPRPMSDVYKLTREHFDRAIDPGTEFHFEVIKKGTHVILKIDDAVVMDNVFDEEFDFFTEGDDYNIGFFAEKCSFEVRNLAVYCDDVEITPEPTASPTPTPSPEPTDTPEKTTSTATSPKTTTGKSDKPGSSSSGVDPLIIGVVAATILVIVVTLIVVILRKKQNR